MYIFIFVPKMINNYQKTPKSTAPRPDPTVPRSVPRLLLLMPSLVGTLTWAWIIPGSSQRCPAMVLDGFFHSNILGLPLKIELN